MCKLQILIAAYGPDALEKIASLPHPSFPGVEYLVCWQNHDKDRIPDSLRERKDFKIYFEESTGLCNNRNALLEKAGDCPVLISDDDLAYKEAHLNNVIEGFRQNPDCHFLTFKYHSDAYPKTYPEEGFDIQNPPKGYFVTSMELALNLKKIRSEGNEQESLYFNPAFGVNGTVFICGEEDLLIDSMLKKGFSGRFVPSEVCVNTDSTTAERQGNTREFIETKGAVISHIRPSTWLPRMLTHALRAAKESGENRIPFLTYCKWWMAGVRKARKKKVFK